MSVTRDWYAVQKSPEDAWDNGSYSYEEAEQMLREQGCGLIAVIVNGDYCKAEIHFDEL